MEKKQKMEKEGKNKNKHLDFLKPQSHIHSFGPGRAMVHPDLASW